MKALFALALFLTVCFVAQAQNTPSNETSLKTGNSDYGCSLDRDGGNYYLISSGKIIKVIDGNTLIFKDSDGSNIRVELLSIDTESNKKESKSFLEKNVLNLKAELFYIPGRADKKKVSAILMLGDKDINRRMLEQGTARYKESKMYTIAYFNDCVNRKSEEKAKNEKLGIWAK